MTQSPESSTAGKLQQKGKVKRFFKRNFTKEGKKEDRERKQAAAVAAREVHHEDTKSEAYRKSKSKLAREVVEPFALAGRQRRILKAMRRNDLTAADLQFVRDAAHSWGGRGAKKTAETDQVDTAHKALREIAKGKGETPEQRAEAKARTERIRQIVSIEGKGFAGDVNRDILGPLLQDTTITSEQLPQEIQKRLQKLKQDHPEHNQNQAVSGLIDTQSNLEQTATDLSEIVTQLRSVAGEPSVKLRALDAYIIQHGTGKDLYSMQRTEALLRVAGFSKFAIVAGITALSGGLATPIASYVSSATIGYVTNLHRLNYEQLMYDLEQTRGKEHIKTHSKSLVDVVTGSKGYSLEGDNSKAAMHAEAVKRAMVNAAFGSAVGGAIHWILENTPVGEALSEVTQAIARSGAGEAVGQAKDAVGNVAGEAVKSAKQAVSPGELTKDVHSLHDLISKAGGGGKTQESALNSTQAVQQAEARGNLETGGLNSSLLEKVSTFIHGQWPRITAHLPGPIENLTKGAEEKVQSAGEWLSNGDKHLNEFLSSHGRVAPDHNPLGQATKPGEVPPPVVDHGRAAFGQAAGATSPEGLQSSTHISGHTAVEQTSTTVHGRTMSDNNPLGQATKPGEVQTQPPSFVDNQRVPFGQVPNSDTYQINSPVPSQADIQNAMHEASLNAHMPSNTVENAMGGHGLTSPDNNPLGQATKPGEVFYWNQPNHVGTDLPGRHLGDLPHAADAIRGGQGGPGHYPGEQNDIQINHQREQLAQAVQQLRGGGHGPVVPDHNGASGQQVDNLHNELDTAKNIPGIKESPTPLTSSDSRMDMSSGLNGSTATGTSVGDPYHIGNLTPHGATADGTSVQMDHLGSSTQIATGGTTHESYTDWLAQHHSAAPNVIVHDNGTPYPDGKELEFTASMNNGHIVLHIPPGLEPPHQGAIMFNVQGPDGHIQHIIAYTDSNGNLSLDPNSNHLITVIGPDGHTMQVPESQLAHALIDQTRLNAEFPKNGWITTDNGAYHSSVYAFKGNIMGGTVTVDPHTGAIRFDDYAAIHATGHPPTDVITGTAPQPITPEGFQANSTFAIGGHEYNLGSLPPGDTVMRFPDGNYYLVNVTTTNGVPTENVLGQFYVDHGHLMYQHVVIEHPAGDKDMPAFEPKGKAITIDPTKGITSDQANSASSTPSVRVAQETWQQAAENILRDQRTWEGVAVSTSIVGAAAGARERIVHNRFVSPALGIGSGVTVGAAVAGIIANLPALSATVMFAPGYTIGNLITLAAQRAMRGRVGGPPNLPPPAAAPPPPAATGLAALAVGPGAGGVIPVVQAPPRRPPASPPGSPAQVVVRNGLNAVRQTTNGRPGPFNRPVPAGQQFFDDVAKAAGLTVVNPGEGQDALANILAAEGLDSARMARIQQLAANGKPVDQITSSEYVAAVQQVRAEQQLANLSDPEIEKLAGALDVNFDKANMDKAREDLARTFVGNGAGQLNLTPERMYSAIQNGAGTNTPEEALLQLALFKDLDSSIDAGDLVKNQMGLPVGVDEDPLTVAAKKLRDEGVSFDKARAIIADVQKKATTAGGKARRSADIGDQFENLRVDAAFDLLKEDEVKGFAKLLNMNGDPTREEVIDEARRQGLSADNVRKGAEAVNKKLPGKRNPDDAAEALYDEVKSHLMGAAVDTLAAIDPGYVEQLGFAIDSSKATQTRSQVIKKLHDLGYSTDQLSTAIVEAKQAAKDRGASKLKIADVMHGLAKPKLRAELINHDLEQGDIQDLAKAFGHNEPKKATLAEVVDLMADEGLTGEDVEKVKLTAGKRKGAELAQLLDDRRLEVAMDAMNMEDGEVETLCEWIGITKTKDRKAIGKALKDRGLNTATVRALANHVYENAQAAGEPTAKEFQTTAEPFLVSSMLDKKFSDNTQRIQALKNAGIELPKDKDDKEITSEDAVGGTLTNSLLGAPLKELWDTLNGSITPDTMSDLLMSAALQRDAYKVGITRAELSSALGVNDEDSEVLAELKKRKIKAGNLDAVRQAGASSAEEMVKALEKPRMRAELQNVISADRLNEADIEKFGEAIDPTNKPKKLDDIVNKANAAGYTTEEVVDILQEQEDKARKRLVDIAQVRIMLGKRLPKDVRADINVNNIPGLAKVLYDLFKNQAVIETIVDKSHSGFQDLTPSERFAAYTCWQIITDENRGPGKLEEFATQEYGVPAHSSMETIVKAVVKKGDSLEAFRDKLHNF